MNQVSNFTDRFKDLMRGTTVTQASEFLGVGKATVSSYLSGARTAKASFLQRIADAYKVDVLWLMGYDVSKHKETPGIAESLSPDKQYLIDTVMSMTEDEVRALRGIVDQVLALRGK